jgi:hypothetical protein
MNSLHCSPVITGRGPLGILVIVPQVALAARFSGALCFDILKTLVGKLRISLTISLYFSCSRPTL